MTTRTILVGSLAMLAVITLGSASASADRIVGFCAGGTNKTTLKIADHGPTKRKITVDYPVFGTLVPPPNVPGALSGATLQVFNSAGGSDAVCYHLAASAWNAVPLMRPRFAKYSDSHRARSGHLRRGQVRADESHRPAR